MTDFERTAEHRDRSRSQADSESFTHDVFLSHSTHDKPVVRELAERLRADGVRVWYDEWEIKLGDSIFSKVEAALQQSRVLMLCMSEHAFGSDWATLESQTFRFRDPLNKQRRFIPLRLDETSPPGSLAQFLYADWREAERNVAYPRLLEACRPSDRRPPHRPRHSKRWRRRFSRSVTLDRFAVWPSARTERWRCRARMTIRFGCGRSRAVAVCHTPVRDRETAMKKLNDGNQLVFCLNCEEKCVPLWDELEERFASDDLRQAVRGEEVHVDFAKRNESKERALVGEVISTVALAGQLSREFSVSDKGLDMEIEFNDDAGNATGQRLYLQLKSGDGHLKSRKRDDAEVFQIKDQRHVSYWMEQAYPVLLVVRNSAGEVRWMEIRDWLREATDNGNKKVTQIAFKGERFDVMSVRRWRDRVLAQKAD